MNLLLSSLKRMAPAMIAAKKGNSFPVIAGPLRGIRLPKPVAIESMAMLVGRYEPGVVSKIRSLAGSIKVAYDVGSHFGYIAVALCRCAGAEHVYAFEPVPSNALMIRAAAVENGLESRIVIVQKALANKNGTQPMHTWRASSMFFLDSARDGQAVNPAESFIVETCTLDSFVFGHSGPVPDFIKLDVEGAEDLVLQGALRTIQTFHPRILIEIHGPKNAEKTWSLLAPVQYEWRHVGEGGAEHRIENGEDLPGLFSDQSWTAHFYLSRNHFGNCR